MSLVEGRSGWFVPLLIMAASGLAGLAVILILLPGWVTNGNAELTWYPAEAVAVGVAAIIIAFAAACFTLPTFIEWRHQLDGTHPTLELVYIENKREQSINDERSTEVTKLTPHDLDAEGTRRGVHFRIGLIGDHQPLADGQINVFIAEPELAGPNPNSSVKWVNSDGRSLLPGVPWEVAPNQFKYGYLLQAPIPPTGDGMRSLYDFTLDVRPDGSSTTLVVTVTGTNVRDVARRVYPVEFLQ